MLKRAEDKTLDANAAEIAAIAAGIFAALGSSAESPASNGGSARAIAAESEWKNAGRREALR